MTLINHLNTLESTGLIRLLAAQPELEYLFRHALVQDAAYGSLLKRDRKQLHLAVGEALEQLYPEQRDEQAATLAYHFERAEVREKAIHYLSRAGDRARDGYANAEAQAFYRAALSQIEQILSRANAPPEAWCAQSAWLFESLGDVLELTGQHAAAEETYGQALAALLQISAPDKIGQARIYRKIGHPLSLTRQYAEAHQTWERAETALGQPPAETTLAEQANAWWREWIEIQVERGWNFYWQGETDEMERLCEKTMPVMERYGTPAQRTRVFSLLALARLRRDRYVASDATLAIGQDALAAAQAAGNPSLLIDAHFGLGLMHLWRRELEQAEKHLRAGLAPAEQTGDVVRESRCVTFLMTVARMRRQLEETQSYLPRVQAMAWASPMTSYMQYVKATLAWLAWRAGDLVEARAQGRASLALLQGPLANAPFKWTALWPLIGVALAEQNILEAVECARALLHPMQMRLPDELAATLEAAIAASEQNQMEATNAQFNRAVSLAQELGYL